MPNFFEKNRKKDETHGITSDRIVFQQHLNERMSLSTMSLAIFVTRWTSRPVISDGLLISFECFYFPSNCAETVPDNIVQHR